MIAPTPVAAAVAATAAIKLGRHWGADTTVDVVDEDPSDAGAVIPGSADVAPGAWNERYALAGKKAPDVPDTGFASVLFVRIEVLADPPAARDWVKAAFRGCGKRKGYACNEYRNARHKMAD